MARFTRDSVDRVKEATDIVEVVSAHTDLQQRGQDYWGELSVPRRADPVVQGQPAGQALLLLRV